MELQFEKLSQVHAQPVIELFNYYIVSSFAAFPDTPIPTEAFGIILEKTKGYPAYALNVGGSIAGFCFLSAYLPFSTFQSMAAISYFLSPDLQSKGVGRQCLQRLEEDARAMGVKNILAEISSRNPQSLGFHKKNGFALCGTIKEAGYKNGETFDIVLMQKHL